MFIDLALMFMPMVHNRLIFADGMIWGKVDLFPYEYVVISTPFVENLSSPNWVALKTLSKIK